MMMEYMSALILGGILGMIGQGLRVIVGLKKLYDALEMTTDGGPSKFDSRRLWLSLFIGFIAGSFGMILKIDYEAVSTMVMNKEFMISIVAIGYMGVDFIEGVMKNYLAKFERNLDAPMPTKPQPNQPQYQPQPTTPNSLPQPTANDGNVASVGIGEDLPVMDQPIDANTSFNIPKDIPKAM
jgi:hypothetical protein